MIERAIAVRLSRAMRVTADLVREDARSRINDGPPDVHLRDHLHTVREAPASYAVVAGDDEAWYGHIVEGGGALSAPRPFLVPALEAQAEDGVARAARALRGL